MSGADLEQVILWNPSIFGAGWSLWHRNSKLN
jgi:hypothetical protein